MSACRLLSYRLAQFADEADLDQKEEDKLLSEETRGKLIRFIEDYHATSADLKKR